MEAQSQTVFKESTDDDAIDLRKYWLTIMRRKWSILFFAFVVTLLVALSVFSIEPTYRAEATLLIESNKANVVSIEEVYGLEGTSSEYFLTQFEILKSRSLAESVVSDFDLVTHPEFNREPTFKFNWREVAGQYVPELAPKEPTAEDTYQAAVDQFIDRLTISPVRKTQLVKISFEAYDPQFAADMANALANAYIDSNLEAKLELTVKASSWLTERLSGLKEKVQESERRLQEFKDQEQIVGGNGGIDIASNELDLVATKLVEARRDRLGIESQYQQIRGISKSNIEALERIPAVLSHPVVQTFKAEVLKAEQRMSELAKRYGPKHPSMIAANSEYRSAKDSLDKQILSVVNGIENEYRVARANERSLESSLGNTKTTLQDLNRKEYRLNELEQEAETNRKLYDTFFTRLNETAATGDLEAANARISDPAVAPRIPAKPRKGLIIALAFVVSVMFGVMCAFLLDALNNTVRGTADIEAKLHQGVLGILPLIPGAKKKKLSYRHYLEDTRGGFSEAVRTIRTSLILSSLDSPKKTIAVTSTVPGEGKTSTSLSLAYSLGQMERVLLIDADMRRPSIGKVFGLDSRAPGLSNLVAGTSSLEEVVLQRPDDGIDVIPAGVIPANPLELLSSERFSKVLAALEGQYDRIIIDTAPCQAVSDSIAIANKVGGMVYVVKSDSTPLPQIKAGIKRLVNANAPLVGVVLNQVNMKKASRYYGEGYSGYYDVYGYSGKA